MNTPQQQERQQGKVEVRVIHEVECVKCCWKGKRSDLEIINEDVFFSYLCPKCDGERFYNLLEQKGEKV